MRREYPEAPIVGVGAVIIDGGRVLLVQRGHEPLKGEWSLPGGALELGETLKQGVVREVLEETGLVVDAVSVVEVLDRIVTENLPDVNLQDETGAASPARIRFHYVLIDYLCRVAGGSLKAASDAADARWVEPGELNEHGIYRLAPITVAVIEKAFRLADNPQNTSCNPY
ncbi:MAG TPA: NUDIX hydrolase [Acidisarcina sp.]|nr:NUDIX hydrolase [Acidisarcina sp.]